MRYAMTIDDKGVELVISDDLTKEQLLVAQEMMNKAIETKLEEIKTAEKNRLPLSASIRSMYPALSGRTQNCLLRAGYKTIEDVLNSTPTQIMQVRNMGQKGFEEVMERFSKYGQFKGDYSLNRDDKGRLCILESTRGGAEE